MQIGGQSIESVARGHLIGFPVPLADHASNPEGQKFVWELIQYVWNLPAPGSVTPLPDDLAASERAMLTRFEEVARQLAASEFLRQRVSFRFTVVDGKRAVVETSFPTTDVETGFITLLRQSLSPGEPASYNKVHALLRARSLAAQCEGNCAVLDRWRFVHRKLLRRSAKTWVHLKVAEQAGVPVAPNMHHPPVDELINTYSYGALIHYGDRRDGLAALEQDDLDRASHRMSLHEAMSSLAAFYAGFAVMISTMFPSVT